MKIVLITTTIYVPWVLEYYRNADPSVTFIITGDEKTPHDRVDSFVRTLGNVLYYDVGDQKALGYECSDVIGWNCVMRRSIALLEAIRLLHPDIIITIDDDNIPLDVKNYFNTFRRVLSIPYIGPVVHGDERWFNVGSMFEPSVKHRGFPYNQESNYVINFGINKTVGVVAGLWYGDPDISAVERIANRPQILQMSDILRQGVVVDNQCFTPFNSQNTGYLGELAPLMAVLPVVGRYDDIWASYIAERVMFETGHHVFYGPPFTWQERNEHNLITNLEDEIFGMRYTSMFCNDLLNMNLGTGSPIEMLARIYEQIEHLSYIPQRLKEFGRAWISDLEKIL